MLTATVCLALVAGAHADAPDLSLSGTKYLVDDLGRITLTVPDTWDDETEPITDGDEKWPHISAAPDLDAFKAAGFAVGVAFVAAPDPVDAEDVFEGLGDTRECSDYRLVSFTNGVFEGTGRWWYDCGEDDASMITLSVYADDESLDARVRLQAASDADFEGLRDVLCSIGIASTADAVTEITSFDVHATIAPPNEFEPESAEPADTFVPDDVQYPC